jgi:hypothetical protein
MKNFQPAICAIFLVARLASASSILPITPDENFDAADAVCRATVIGIQSYREPSDGMIYTRTLLRVDEGFKGKFAPTLAIVHRGGTADGIGLFDDASPQFKAGDESILFLSQRNGGKLSVRNGSVGAVKLRRDKTGALSNEHQELLDGIRRKGHGLVGSGSDFTSQSAAEFLGAPSGDAGGASTNGLIAAANGSPSRFSLPDRGEPIPYLVDATVLPAGISQAQALNAVSNAMSVWASASSFRFIFAGTANFGTAAANITNNDGVFRIQLYDTNNFIPPGNILGEGGSWFTFGVLTNAPHWGPGGKVTGMEFNQGLNGWVVLKHTNVAMQTLSTFTEVLTHEVGHVIGLAHSSEIVTNDPTLTNSIMYWLAHGDGRGAKLNSYDTNVVREVHPLNTPPYTYNRMMDVTDASPQPSVPGINEVEVRGYDLQNDSVTLSITNIDAPHGTFSTSGNRIIFTPAILGDGPRVDPGGNQYYELLYARITDVTNSSPYVKVKVVSLSSDSDSPSDGIPDSWMSAYFGHADPQSGDKSRASDDADGDRLTNLQEYIAGMDPVSAASAQRATIYSTNVIQWQAKAYELYEIQGVTNLVSTNWTRVGNPVVPTNSVGIFTNYLSATNPAKFFRIQKVP